jgi:hypothetical protein
MKASRRSVLAFGVTAAVLTVAAAAVAIPGFGKMAMLDREAKAKERLRSGTGPTPGYVLVPSPLGKQAIPEVYGETGRYTFFTHPDYGVLKLDTGGKLMERIPSDKELGITRPLKK